jgi:hypothetical protein
MKRLIKRFSFIGIAIATALLIIGLSIPINSNKPAIAFEYFPLNEAQTVNFQAKAASLRNLTERQKKDQFLDWLLFTVESDPSFSTKEIIEASYDISPVRYDYLKPVSNFEYGKTRSLYVGNETIVALIPKVSSPEQRIDYLNHIADKHRQNLGRIPENLEVFEYQLDLGKETAQLTRVEELNTISLFQDKQYGYHQRYIRNLDDLNQFMAKVDDITFAQVINSKLIVGGRKIQSHSYGKISVEDVAALWQSEHKIQQEIKQLITDVKTKYLFNNQRLTQTELQKKYAEEWQKRKLVNGSGFSLDSAYNYQGLKESLTKITPRLVALNFNGKSIFTNQEIEQVQQSLSQKDIVPYLKLIEKLQLKRSEAFEAVSNEIRGEVERYEKQLVKQNRQKAENIKQSKISSVEKLEKLWSIAQEYYEKINNFEQNIRGSKLQSFYQASSVKDSILAETEITNFFETLKTQSFQKARYDGYLQGTEVGMVLYYTDLLAKLWALDYLGTTPEKYIADFQPLTQRAAKVSSIYKQELKELPSTRVWFGHQDKGFQVADNDNKLFFNRNATRIYAASSNPLKPGKETTATADSEAFLGWWNEHYEEVARYEPQYERLNEIMKWSLVVSWLNQSEQGKLLWFLQGVQVNHNHWFPDWVQAKIEQLKFKEWDTKTCPEDFDPNSEQPKVCFYPHGYQSTTTEAMPRLSSELFLELGEWRFVSGGVSLANRKVLAARISLPKVTKISDRSLRSNIDYKSIKLKNKILSFKTLDGAIYNLKITPELASVIAKAKDGAKLRNLDSELANIELIHQISRTDDGITINALAEDTNIGSVNISKTGNALTVAWRSQDIDLGKSIALELSRRPRNINIETFLKNDPKVNVVAKQKDAYVYYIKTDNSEKWLKLASGGGNGGDIPPDYISRVASIEPPDNFNGRKLSTSDDSEDLLLGWVDEDDLDGLEAEVIFSRSKPKKSSIYDDIRNGDYIAAAPQIIRQKKLNKALTEIHSLMERKDYKRAAKLVDNSIDKWGQEPDLMIRKAVVNIKLKRLKVEAVSIEELKRPNSADFFDEINEILENQNKGKFKAIEKEDAFIYAQDSPELDKIDWNNPIENSIPSISGKTRVYKLQNGEVGNINLDDFFGGNGGSLPPGKGGKGGNKNGNQPPNSSGSGKYNNSQYYRDFFSRTIVTKLAGENGQCDRSQEEEIKTAQCKQEEKNVYIMYVRN